MQPSPPSTASDLPAVLAAARRARRRRAFVSLLLLALLVAGAVHWQRQRAARAASPAIEYVSAEVTRGALTVKVTATGTLQPLNQVDVGSELSGMVEEVLVDFNDTVKRGQVLARLDTQRLNATAVQARGSLASAEARLREAEATAVETELKAGRCAKLAEKQMCSKDDLDASRAAEARARASVASAKAGVAVARAALEERETELAKAVIQAPIDGIVLKRLIEPGQTVAAMMQTPLLFTLAENLTQMELQVAVDEADVGRVAVGQRASFTVDAYPNREFPAVITQVRYAPESKDGVVTYTTALSVENADLALRPGMTATAEIVVREVEDTLMVPNAALRFEPPAATNRADEGGLLGKLMMRFPSRQTSTRPEEPKGKERRLYLLEGATLKPVTVTIGETDERQTAVSGGGLAPGTRVAVDYRPAAR
ncbi:MAG: efflux RND transporter periplasmic adaptor subunit [Gammaproteobacteria bacterium]|nr:efflux RND transporter periplasmic adaptor subunit [Gammaproteobacteria bacterium]